MPAIHPPSIGIARSCLATWNRLVDRCRRRVRTAIIYWRTGGLQSYVYRTGLMLNVRRPRRTLRGPSIHDLGVRPSQVVVYTANFGGYDHLRPIEFSDVACVCFTDDRSLNVRGWQTTVVDADHPRRAARRIKILGHESLTPYEYSVWIDGNLDLQIDPVVLVQKFLQRASVAAFRHPERNCTYQEAEMVKYLSLDDSFIVDDQMRRYRTDRFPRRYGLIETAVFVRRCTPQVAAFNKAWWTEVDRGSQRDQLSVMYALWKTGQMNYFAIPGCRERSKLVQHHSHGNSSVIAHDNRHGRQCNAVLGGVQRR